MRFAFSPDQLAMQTALRALLEKECPAPVVRAAWTSDTGHSPALWRSLTDFGLVGLTADAAHGGVGLDELDLVLLLEECGRAAVPAPVLEATAVAAPLLRDAANDALNARWQPALASGEAVVTVGLAGSDFVVAANVADLVLLERSGELHAVPAGALTRTAQRSVDGSRRLFTVQWEPSAETLVADGEVASRAIAAARDRGALAAAAQLLGLARQMIAMTVGHVTVRKQFGDVAREIGPSMGAEDFALLSQLVPSFQLGVGSGAPGGTEGLHNSRYAPDEACIGLGVQALSRAALELLS